MDLRAICLLAVASHVVFCKHEPSVAVVVAIYAAGSLAFLALIPASSTFDLFVSLLAALATYTSTLLFSIGVYRFFLHRIRHIPGPIKSSLSNWASVSFNLKGQRCYVVDKLHKKYGNVIRTGPRAVSVKDVMAVQAILGASSNLYKGPSYGAIQAGKGPRSFSVLSTRSPSEHRARRPPWDAAFRVGALKSYEGTLKEIVNKLVRRLDDFAVREQVIDIGKWCQFLTFDIMSELGFSSSFNLIDKGDFSRPIKVLQNALGLIMGIGAVPYVATLARLLPNPIAELEEFAENALEQRAKGDGIVCASRDIMSHLVNDDPETKPEWELTWKELIGDASVIIVAGSDTSSLAMAMTLYNLMGHPHVLQQLRDELGDVFGDEEVDDFDRLGKRCKVLDAVINETLRLYPPVPSGAFRETYAHGLIIPMEQGPVIIPGNIVVSVPTYSLHRDSRYWSPQPDAFRPERWLHPEKEEAFNKDAFIPFSFGPTGCVGKALAWMEMRLFVATFVQRYDFTPAHDFDYAAYPRTFLDSMTTVRTLPLSVVLKRRVKSV